MVTLLAQRIQRLFLATALLVALAPLAPVQTAAAAELSPADFLNSDGSLDLPENLNGSFDLSGWDVQLDAEQGVRLQPASQPALATYGAWSAIGGVHTGVTGTVRTFLNDGDVLYVGGDFHGAGVLNANNVATFSGGAWSALNTGVNNKVYALAVDGGVLYAGGEFTNAGGDADADYVAKYSGGAWSSLGGSGTGLNNIVWTLLVDGGVLYAGGNFSDAGGDADADGIAKFSGGAWSSLGGPGTGLNGGIVFSMLSDGGVLYIAGSFVNAGGDADADEVAKFESGAWSSLGGAGTGLNNSVLSLILDNGVFYAGGNFTDAGGDLDADRVAKYSGGAWSSLGGSGTGLNSTVQSLAIYKGVLFAGGFFNNAGGDPDADRVAKFEDGAWSSLNGANTGLNAGVYHLAVDDGVLYAGGQLSNAGGDADADYIAQFGLVEPSSSTASSGPTINKDIASSGTTVLQSGRILVSVPSNAVPGGESDCRISITEKGDSASYGFSLDDKVWDVKIVCDSGTVSILYAPISVCIRPQDGATNNKQVFHRHGGGDFTALASSGDVSGYVCGQTQTLSLFTLGSVAVPNTGFAPGVVTVLPEQPSSAAYIASDLTLNIPELGLEMDIVGVPQGPNGWDVSWLGNDAGYLYGTAFPTMAGNTVLTAHVWNADNTPGPFAELDQLQYGDRFTISAWGSTYTYEVRSTSLYSPNSLSPLRHEDYDWVTLITCHDFNERTGSYSLRRVVRAVLVSID